MKSNALKQKCSGLWPKVILSLSPTLRQAIKKRPNPVACPVHGGKDGLRCFNDFEDTGGIICNTCGPYPDGIAALMWVNDWTFAKTIANIEAALAQLGTSKIHYVTSEIPTIPSYGAEKRQQALQILRNELVPLDVSEAKAGLLYLKNRGLSLATLPDNLLFHPNLNYYEDGLSSYYPALVALITNLDDEYASMLRIYITEDGQKAPVASPKKMMPAAHSGATKGLAIQLFPATDKLAITEGVETALAVHQATSLPVWAAVSAGGMRNIEIPDSVAEVSIWCDKDKSQTGEKAGQYLEQRLLRAGKLVKLIVPEDPIPPGQKGIDWLDVLVKN